MKQIISTICKHLIISYAVFTFFSGFIFQYTWIQMVFFNREVKWIGNVFHTDDGINSVKHDIDWLKETVLDMSLNKKRG